MKNNNVKMNEIKNKLGVEKLNELSEMLNKVGIFNLPATNEVTKKYGILLECSCCGELYCLKSYNYNELMSVNLKEEVYNLMINEEIMLH